MFDFYVLVSNCLGFHVWVFCVIIVQVPQRSLRCMLQIFIYLSKYICFEILNYIVTIVIKNITKGVIWWSLCFIMLPSFSSSNSCLIFSCFLIFIDKSLGRLSSFLEVLVFSIRFSLGLFSLFDWLFYIYVKKLKHIQFSIFYEILYS